MTTANAQMTTEAPSATRVPRPAVHGTPLIARSSSPARRSTGTTAALLRHDDGESMSHVTRLMTTGWRPTARGGRSEGRLFCRDYDPSPV